VIIKIKANGLIFSYTSNGTIQVHNKKQFFLTLISNKVL